MAYTYAGRYVEALIDLQGDALVSTEVRVYVAGTDDVAALFTSRTKAVAAVNPTLTGTDGNLSFYADPGAYEIAAIVAGVEQARKAAVVGLDPVEFTDHTATDLAGHGGLPDHAALHAPAGGDDLSGTYATKAYADAADAVLEADIAAVADLQRLPTADFTAAETRPDAAGRVLCVVDESNVPPTDTIASPHPGNPKPGDIVIVLPAGT
jgi:hypothetical protein